MSINKNNDNAAIVKATFAPSSGITDARAAMEAAKEALAAAKRGMVEDVVSTLRQDGRPGGFILCKDIAAKYGVRPCDVGSVMAGPFGARIRTKSVTIARRFLEVDENGNPVEGAPLIVKEESRAAYTLAK